MATTDKTIVNMQTGKKPLLILFYTLYSTCVPDTVFFQGISYSFDAPHIPNLLHIHCIAQIL